MNRQYHKLYGSCVNLTRWGQGVISTAGGDPLVRQVWVWLSVDEQSSAVAQGANSRWARQLQRQKQHGRNNAWANSHSYA
eukprot:13221585-Alexandrium_andersonii.AAC.1